MKKEKISDYLRRRLDELAGHHNRISRESGVPQATVSRIHAGLCSPRLATVQPLLDWLAEHDKNPSALRITHTRGGLKAGRARTAAAPAIGDQCK